MKAKIFYANLPHPSKSRVMANLYRQIHFNKESNHPITISKSFFETYWRKLPIKEDIDNDNLIQGFEKIFEKYNSYETNPLSINNNPEQSIIRNRGIHHTSMSVGDVIEVENKKYIICGLGFKRLKLSYIGRLID